MDHIYPPHLCGWRPGGPVVIYPVLTTIIKSNDSPYRLVLQTMLTRRQLAKNCLILYWLSSDLLLINYNPKREIIVSGDASSFGLGPTFSHKFPRSARVKHTHEGGARL